MKRAGHIVGRATLAASTFSLLLVVGACEEDGKTVPERCAVLPAPRDIHKEPPPGDDNRSLNPGSGGQDGLPKCVTEIGHAVSSIEEPGTGGSATGGTGGAAGSAGSTAGGTSSGGSSSGGDAGTAGADAGAGGA